MVVTISSETIRPNQPKDESSESKGFETVCGQLQYNHFLNGGTRFQMLCMSTNQIRPGRLFPSLRPVRGWREMQPRTPKPPRVHAWLGLQSVTRHNEVEHKLNPINQTIKSYTQIPPTPTLFEILLFGWRQLPGHPHFSFQIKLTGWKGYFPV